MSILYSKIQVSLIKTGRTEESSTSMICNDRAKCKTKERKWWNKWNVYVRIGNFHVFNVSVPSRKKIFMGRVFN
jgi:hypothetical protein